MRLVSKKRIILIAVVIAAFAVAFVFYAVYKPGRLYVAKIGKYKVSAGEYVIYLHEQKKLFEEIGGADIWKSDFDGELPENVAKQNALNSIALVKTVCANAYRFSVALNEEEAADAREWAEAFMDELNPDVSKKYNIDKDLLISIKKDSDLYEKVLSHVGSEQLLNEDYAQWSKTVVIEKNYNVWDTIGISDLP